LPQAPISLDRGNVLKEWKKTRRPVLPNEKVAICQTNEPYREGSLTVGVFLLTLLIRIKSPSPNYEAVVGLYLKTFAEYQNYSLDWNGERSVSLGRRWFQRNRGISVKAWDWWREKHRSVINTTGGK